jgi:type I restriction enzyme S subunit
MGHGANQRNLNAALIKGFCFSFPHPEEQEQIVETLGAVDARLVLHQSKYTAYVALFHSLLHQFLSTQLRIHSLDLSGLENA